jgi:hypothetical protein
VIPGEQRKERWEGTEGGEEEGGERRRRGRRGRREEKKREERGGEEGEGGERTEKGSRKKLNFFIISELQSQEEVVLVLVILRELEETKRSIPLLLLCPLSLLLLMVRHSSRRRRRELPQVSVVSEGEGRDGRHLHLEGVKIARAGIATRSKARRGRGTTSSSRGGGGRVPFLQSLWEGKLIHARVVPDQGHHVLLALFTLVTTNLHGAPRSGVELRGVRGGEGVGGAMVMRLQTLQRTLLVLAWVHQDRVVRVGQVVEIIEITSSLLRAVTVAVARGGGARGGSGHVWEGSVAMRRREGSGGGGDHDGTV